MKKLLQKSLFLLVLASLLGCGGQESVKTAKIDGYTVKEVNFEGCQYLIMYDSFTHKGNCTNEIHILILIIEKEKSAIIL